MNELVRVTTNEQGDQVVSARELWKALEVSREFSKWVDKYMLKSPYFAENQDYIRIANNGESKMNAAKNYAVTLDTAKKLAMTVNSEKGNQVRDYFLECEKQLTASIELPQTKLEWMKLAVETEEANQSLRLEVSTQAQKIEENKPKVNYFDKVLDSEDCLTITQIAGIVEMTASALNDLLKQEGVQYKQSGQWHLKADYKGNGYTKTRTHVFTKRNGDSATSHSLVWTEKGKAFICDLLERV